MIRKKMLEKMSYLPTLAIQVGIQTVSIMMVSTDASVMHIVGDLPIHYKLGIPETFVVRQKRRSYSTHEYYED